jgi:hypothetical protein
MFDRIQSTRTEPDAAEGGDLGWRDRSLSHWWKARVCPLACRLLDAQRCCLMGVW